jgi:hypothetical protein
MSPAGSERERDVSVTFALFFGAFIALNGLIGVALLARFFLGSSR